jgi:hypothetical protein
MHEGGIKSGARRVMHVFFVIFAIVVIFYFGKVVLSYINSDGTVVGGFGSCKDGDGLSILDKAGVFGNLHPKCTDDDESSDDEKNDDGENDEESEEEEDTSKKKSSWRRR